MGLEILFGAKLGRSTVIEALELDASLSEEHTSEAEVTEHPIETGSDISDHKRKKPVQVKITGLITNTPLRFFNFDSGDAAVSAWDVLQQMQQSKVLLTVITSLKTYENMAIVALSAPRDAKRGHSLEFTATMREIFTAKSETVAPPLSPAKPPKDLGKKATEAADESATTTLLQKGVGAIKALF